MVYSLFRDTNHTGLQISYSNVEDNGEEVKLILLCDQNKDVMKFEEVSFENKTYTIKGFTKQICP